VRVFEALMGGLDDTRSLSVQPGNVATEDLLWTFERMGAATSIDRDAFIPVARNAAWLPGRRVRDAITHGRRLARRRQRQADRP
jgi:hydroxymethylglutaryl-CoA lyase